jgi:hypothetical protein
MTVPARSARGALRQLTPGRGRLLFLVEDSVFEQVPEHPVRRVGRLSDHLRELAGAGCPPSGRWAGVVGEARSYAVQLCELRFVLEELLPLLRSLGPGRGASASRPPDLSGDFRGLEQGARLLRNALEECETRLDPAACSPKDRLLLARVLGLPCVLAGTAVIPLQPVLHSRRGNFTVVLDGTLYRYHLEATRPLMSFLQAIQRAAVWSSNSAVAQHPSLQQRAADFLRAVQSLLSACGVARPVTRFPLAEGSWLELQHRGGSWVLVYGPARRRVADRAPLWVGLPIGGKSRRERLSMAPAAAHAADGFFLPSGEPKRGGVCLGRPAQYQRLHSEFFTDAEAVVYWLDASVVVATGRSLFHQQWRDRRRQQRALRRPVL